jgi:hypothetical protein
LEDVPGSGATRFGATLASAFNAAALGGSSKEGAMFRLDPSVLAVVLMEETWSVDKSPRRGKTAICRKKRDATDDIKVLDAQE